MGSMATSDLEDRGADDQEVTTPAASIINEGANIDEVRTHHPRLDVGCRGTAIPCQKSSVAGAPCGGALTQTDMLSISLCCEHLEHARQTGKIEGLRPRGPTATKSV